MSTRNTDVPSSMQPLSPTHLIRAARLEDLPQLADLLATSFYPPEGWSHWLYPLMRMGIYEDLKHRLRTRTTPHYLCLTAVRYSQSYPSVQHGPNFLSGTVEMSSRPLSFMEFMKPKQLYLSNLAVDPTCRRQGVAQQLLRTCERFAREWGFQDLYLHVMEDNTQAQQLYLKAGYQLCHTEHTLWTWIAKQPKRLLMRKLLNPTPDAAKG